MERIPNAKVSDGHTCLFTAVESEDQASLQILSKLLAAGADVHGTGMNGWTPLHMAAARGQVEKARLIIKAGADVNRRIEIDAEKTPLMEAASEGRAEAVRLLLECGADPTMRDTIRGWTPIQMAEYAVKGADPDVIDYLQSPDCLRMHAEVHSQIIEEVFGCIDMSAEQREAMPSVFGKSDPVEQYRQAAEENLGSRWRIRGSHPPTEAAPLNASCPGPRIASAYRFIPVI